MKIIITLVCTLCTIGLVNQIDDNSLTDDIIGYSDHGHPIYESDLEPEILYYEIPPLPEEQRLCLAKNIYFEARNQSLDGQIAVAQVTLNRVTSDAFPDTICEVVYQGTLSGHPPRKHRCQFSWYCDGKSDTPRDSIAWAKSLEVADAVWAGVYTSKVSATYYHAEYVEPHWSHAMAVEQTIGEHVFYTN